MCGQSNTANHALTCKLGGFVHLRHDSLKRTTARLLEQVCNDVEIEPALINITTEQLPKGTTTADGAALDVSVRGFWTPLDRAFTDIRVLHPQAPSNSNKSLRQLYTAHENEKKYRYNAQSSSSGKSYLYTACVQHHWRNGGRGSQVLQAPSGEDEQENWAAL